MKTNATQLTRTRKGEDICENCIHCFATKTRIGMDIRTQDILECRLEPPQNIFTKEGLIIQAKTTFPGYFCASFEK